MLQKPKSDFEIEIHNKLLERHVHGSRYEFLKKHNGIRPNCLHGMIGTMGSGKSTLFKCVIAETASNSKVLVWLSEEKVVEYQPLLNYLDRSCVKNIAFVEEKQIPKEYKENHENFCEYFEQMVEESEAEVVFIDNITTSAFYNNKFGLNGQVDTADYFIDFVKRKCSVFYVGHTSSEVTDNFGKVVSPEQIRGSKHLPILTEYMYIMQKFTTEEKQYNVLRVAKYRHHEEARGWYALKYEKKAYIGDSKVPFAVINRIFKMRDFFGKKSPVKKKDETKDDVKNEKPAEESPQNKLI